jgi:hypothetical protein
VSVFHKNFENRQDVNLPAKTSKAHLSSDRQKEENVARTSSASNTQCHFVASWKQRLDVQVQSEMSFKIDSGWKLYFTAANFPSASKRVRLLFLRIIHERKDSRRIFRKKRKRTCEGEGIDLLQAHFSSLSVKMTGFLELKKNFWRKNCGF